MKKFIIEDAERMRILSLHKEIITEAGPQPGDPRYDLLDSYRNAGCFKGKMLPIYELNGEIFCQANSRTQGQVIRFFSDNTYGTFDSKTQKQIGDRIPYDCQSYLDKKAARDLDISRTEGVRGYKKRSDIQADDWEIKSIYEEHPQYKGYYKLKVGANYLTGMTDNQKAFIEEWQKKNFVLVPSPEQIAQGKMKPYKVPNSQNYFQGGITMYYDPANYKQGTVTSTFAQTRASQSVSREDCKKAIDEFYAAFSEGTTFDASEIEPMKEKVRRCKKKYYKNWSRLGIFDGGNALDSKLDKLSGIGSDAAPISGPGSEYKIS